MIFQITLRAFLTKRRGTANTNKKHRAIYKACREKNEVKIKVKQDVKKEETKPYLKEYHQRHKEGYLERSKRKCKTHKEELQKYHKEYYEQNTEQASSHFRKYYLRTAYNMTANDYDVLLSDQQLKCIGCGAQQENLKAMLCANHYYRIAEIRGLPYEEYNIGLGKLGDNPAGASKVALHLAKTDKDKPEKIFFLLSQTEERLR